MTTRSAAARIGEVKFKQETVAGEAIGTASTYWAATPYQIRAHDIDISGLKTGSLPDPSVQSDAFADPINLLVAKTQVVKFKALLTKLAATTPAQDPLGRLLTAAMGAQSLGPALTTVDATNTGAGATAPLKVTSTASFAAGQAIKTNGYLRRIVSISSPNLTLDHDLPAVYTSGNVQGSQTNYLSQLPIIDIGDAGHISHAFLFRGLDAADQWQMRGGFPEIELLDLGKKDGPPKVGVTLMGLDWEKVASVAVGAAFTEPNPASQVGTGWYYNQTGTVTNNTIPARNFAVKLGLKVEALESPLGAQGIQGYAVNVGRTEVEFEVLPDQAAALHTAWAAQTLYVGCGLQLGADVLISFPQLVIDEEPSRVGGGSLYWKIKMHANNGPTTTNELTKSRVAIHRFG